MYHQDFIEAIAAREPTPPEVRAEPIAREVAAARYKAARIAAGYPSGAGVARILKVDPTVEHALESGKMTPLWPVLLERAALLGLEPSILFPELFSRTGPTGPPDGQLVCMAPMGEPTRIEKTEAGRRLHAARVAAGWGTIAGAAKAAGIDRTYLRDLETGRRVCQWPALLALAVNLRLDPAILFPELFAADRIGTPGHPRPEVPPAPKDTRYVPRGTPQGRPRIHPRPDPLAPKRPRGRPRKVQDPAIGTPDDRDENPGR